MWKVDANYMYAEQLEVHGDCNAHHMMHCDIYVCIYTYFQILLSRRAHVASGLLLKQSLPLADIKTNWDMEWEQVFDTVSLDTIHNVFSVITASQS
jgi:hypothetical protein